MLFVFLLNGSYAQQWSDPINISNSDDVDGFPDICVDTNGVLHCVWSKKFTSSYRCVYYSNSTDQGETWSTPVKISHNNSGEISDPLIVSDKSNNLYVIYKFDMNIGGENIWFTKNNEEYWSTPVTMADGWPGLFPEDLTIDNNDRVYVFWRYFDNKFHYRYYENNAWSEVSSPYSSLPDSYSVNVIESISDKYNNLHCIGRYREPGDEPFTTAYYYYDYQNNNWIGPELIGTYYSSTFQDISLDTNNNPHLVYREGYEGTVGPDATFYKHKTEGQWSETELIVEDPKRQKIDIAGNKVFIVDYEKEGDDYNAVFYKKGNLNQWEGQIFLVNSFIGIFRLFHDNNFLYVLLNSKIDNENILDIYLMKTPIDSLIVTSVSRIKSLNNETVVLNQNYPNPFNYSTKISFELNSRGNTRLLIMTVQGTIINRFEMGIIGKGKYSVIWDGTDLSGNKLPNGYYYYRLIVDDRQKTKSLILNR